MAITLYDSGTLTTTGGAEGTLSTLSDPGVYVFEARIDDVAAADSITFSCFKKAYNAGTAIHAVDSAAHSYYGAGYYERAQEAPYVIPFSGYITATSTIAAKSVPWRVLRVAGVSVEDTGVNDYITGGGPTFDETADGVYVAIVDASDAAVGDQVTLTVRSRNADSGTAYILEANGVTTPSSIVESTAFAVSGSFYGALVGTALTGTVTIGYSIVRVT